MRGVESGRAGADPSFEAWYRREHPRLITSLLLVSGDLHAAQEAVDEAFARALAHWHKVGRMASPNGWAYRVALNVLRRRGRRASIERRLLARPGQVPVADLVARR